MTENSRSENREAVAAAGTEREGVRLPVEEAADAEGQYVEGDYGNAGAGGNEPAHGPGGRVSDGGLRADAGAVTAASVGAEEGDDEAGDDRQRRRRGRSSRRCRRG